MSMLCVGEPVGVCCRGLVCYWWRKLRGSHGTNMLHARLQSFQVSLFKFYYKRESINVWCGVVTFNAGFLVEVRIVVTFNAGFLVGVRIVVTFNAGFLVEVRIVVTFNAGFLVEVRIVVTFNAGFLVYKSDRSCYTVQGRRHDIQVRLVVFPGVGTRNYYRKMDYELEGPYMTKLLTWQWRVMGQACWRLSLHRQQPVVHHVYETVHQLADIITLFYLIMYYF